MLLTTKQLKFRFEENLRSAGRVYIASAWATQSWALNRLCEVANDTKLQIRSIIGTYGSATDPDALGRLNNIGELRLVNNQRFLFHPKVYIFIGNEQSCAWIGSANFTSGGFESNEEVVYETSYIDPVIEWFSRRWAECVELPENAIEDYCARRQREGVDKQLRKVVLRESAITNTPLADDANWARYYLAMKDHDAHCRYLPNVNWDILGNVRSYVHTIAIGQELMQRDSWIDLDDEQSRILRGLNSADGIWGLLGEIRFLTGDARALIVPDRIPNAGNIRETVRILVNQVIEADDKNIAIVAQNTIQEIMKLKGFGPAIATRLVALARPDRLVSVNAKSSKGLQKIAKMKGDFQDATERANFLAENYAELLAKIYEYPWVNEAQPDNSDEWRIWRCRVALLDAFVYEELNDWVNQ